jgi:hypothetical protein
MNFKAQDVKSRLQSPDRQEQASSVALADGLGPGRLSLSCHFTDPSQTALQPASFILPSMTTVSGRTPPQYRTAAAVGSGVGKDAWMLNPPWQAVMFKRSRLSFQVVGDA